MDCLLVADNIIVAAKGSFIDCLINHNHKIISIEDSPDSNNSVCDLAISNNNEYLATLTSDKNLTIYKLPSFDRVNLFVLPRSASKIRFGAENSHIFVADKTGDVLFYDILKNDSGVKLLGHLSFLLNVLQSQDGNYLISADRDEKIRVSCYPNTYNIQTYCLGHKEYVNHIEFLPHNNKYLLSASGDGTVKCWDYVTGHCTCTINTKKYLSDSRLEEEFKKIMDEDGIEVESLPIIHFTTSKLNENTSLVAISIYSCNDLLIYTIQTGVQFHYKLTRTLQLKDSFNCIHLFNTALYVFNSSNNILIKYDITNSDNNIAINESQTIEMFNNTKIDVKIDLEQNIKILFKRKFDNVQEYQERKKNRLIKKT
ncbi:tRNA (guanine-N(7)-)-methyltransferase non-catalytic subunit wuho [Pieris rapae]|uniref:tRNA (guanine-N(7)-)-methyltransferase non-catalytic subunit wuho n=1 Tax=Pieris rapae TaxID=64459 RepID=UPI001E280E60|nr:tRNA (guanine-N(7)-)-methyltransferase non-catalytic subunit wuho [Pieris rapae]